MTNSSPSDSPILSKTQKWLKPYFSEWTICQNTRPLCIKFKLIDTLICFNYNVIYIYFTVNFSSYNFNKLIRKIRIFPFGNFRIFRTSFERDWKPQGFFSLHINTMLTKFISKCRKPVLTAYRFSSETMSSVIYQYFSNLAGYSKSRWVIFEGNSIRIVISDLHLSEKQFVYSRLCCKLYYAIYLYNWCYRQLEAFITETECQWRLMVWSNYINLFCKKNFSAFVSLSTVLQSMF